MPVSSGATWPGAVTMERGLEAIFRRVLLGDLFAVGEPHPFQRTRGSPPHSHAIPRAEIQEMEDLLASR